MWHAYGINITDSLLKTSYAKTKEEGKE
jgi:hypothetical protein